MPGTEEWDMAGVAKRQLGRCGLVVAIMAGFSVAAWAQQQPAPKPVPGNPKERDVKPKPNVQDPDEIFEKDGKTYKDNSKIWVLEFKFKDPRLITVDIPGRGRKVCWSCRPFRRSRRDPERSASKR